ncbi:hypothetical protein LOK49_LG07G01419 [Camellia lanceoleosa]|uniref:Uncharacterized protein n=1 Tax=Camellia lanceoleosa TaxID=1840588 RepID=A0ACC0H753_9ERIC|nr:hypothetical protein LOK49_LG07G01419 [Camellia lanceoleosa]
MASCFRRNVNFWVVEQRLGHLPFIEKQVVTPTGQYILVLTFTRNCVEFPLFEGKYKDQCGEMGKEGEARGIERPNHEHHSTNSDQPLVIKPEGSAKLDDNATSTGQPLVMSPVPFMPEKRILELVLDILQR